MERKGFPESFDHDALARFLIAVRGGAAETHAPVYSHATYDIVDGETQVVERPSVLILEGLPFPDDHVDFTVYLDAATSDIEEWYVQRFCRLVADAAHRRLVVLPPVRRLLARAGRRDRPPGVGLDQPGEPRGAHPPDPRPQRRDPGEGSGPHGRAREASSRRTCDDDEMTDVSRRTRHSSTCSSRSGARWLRSGRRSTRASGRRRASARAGRCRTTSCTSPRSNGSSSATRCRRRTCPTSCPT